MVSGSDPETFNSTDHSAVSHTAAYLATDAVETAKIKADAVTAAKVSGQLDVDTMNASGHILLIPSNYNAIGQGTWVIYESASAFYGGFFENTSNADGDNLSLEAFLSKGTYTMRVMHYKGTNRGIVDFDIAGVEVGSVDTYAGAASQNNLYTEASIAVATSGMKTIRIRVDGKNGSSSDHYVGIQAIAFWRTA